MAGLAPEDVEPGVHAMGALVGLVTLNLAMIALGWSIRSVRPRLARVALGAGVVGLVGTGYFLSGAALPGISERISDYPSAAMVIALGAALLATSVSRRKAATSA